MMMMLTRRIFEGAKKIFGDLYAAHEDCFNGTNETVNIFNQKCISCFGNPSVYAFRQCSHQFLCVQCCTDLKVEMLKGAVCRTQKT